MTTVSEASFETVSSPVSAVTPSSAFAFSAGLSVSGRGALSAASLSSAKLKRNVFPSFISVPLHTAVPENPLSVPLMSASDGTVHSPTRYPSSADMEKGIYVPSSPETATVRLFSVYDIG